MTTTTLLTTLLTSLLLLHNATATSSSQRSFSNRWSEAKQLASLEQQVEDHNAQYVATHHPPQIYRRLICLPLDERFDPPMGVFSHNHVQTGDKVSLPRVFWDAIQLTKAQVPWLVEIRRVEGVTGDRVHMPEQVPLEKVVGGPLDFRAPSNYCFLPWWMMRALGLQPRDVVDVQLITTVPPGSAAQLRPHSSQFASDISNPQAVLETELRHYSSLTKGSQIAFDYNGKRYWFHVEELRSAPRGEKCPMIKVQDCDIATDFLPAKDNMQKKRKKHHNAKE
jgi:hypothetical protein